MKSDNILAALNDIDPELIEDAEGQHKPSRMVVFLKWGAVAAVVCVISAFALGYFLAEQQSNPSIPIYPNALYTAAEIGDFFGGTYAEGGTSSYRTVYVSSSDFLDFHHSVPTSAYLPIYHRNTEIGSLDQNAFAQFADRCLQQITNELGIQTPSYEIKRQTDYTGRETLSLSNYHHDGYDFYAAQNVSYHHFSFNADSSAWREIRLGDIAIEVDQTKSNEEIIDSLSPIAEKLFSIFGEDFSDVKVLRVFDNDSEYGVTHLIIYFYNESDHPLNSIMDVPHSDYIQLEFRNYQHSLGGIVSDTILQDVDVRYYQFRTDTKELYPVSKQAATISLQEAEALLYNGYVFGGHSCPLCMSMQEKVDFHNYDFVDIVYLSSYSRDLAPKEFLPFYAFYKKIGTAKNGNEIYALTYVPAIEVSGYEEYFKSQEANHRN